MLWDGPHQAAYKPASLWPCNKQQWQLTVPLRAWDVQHTCPPLLAERTQHFQVDAATTRATAGVQVKAGESVALLLNMSPAKSSLASQDFT